MAIFRKIHVTFWSDSFVSNLTEKEKLFYLYLLTNERTTQIGIYEITKKQIAFDLGYSINIVSDYLKLFQKHGKIMYNETTCEIAIKNWNKYNHNPSIKVKVLVNKELDKVKDKLLIEYLYSTDIVSIHKPQEEEEQEEEIEKDKDKESEIEILKTDLEIAFDCFLEMRKKIKKPATDRAIEMAKKKVMELSNGNEQLAIEIINQSTLNCWSDLYPLKQTQTQTTPSRRTTNEVVDRVKQEILNGQLEIKPII